MAKNLTEIPIQLKDVLGQFPSPVSDVLAAFSVQVTDTEGEPLGV